MLPKLYRVMFMTALTVATYASAANVSSANVSSANFSSGDDDTGWGPTAAAFVVPGPPAGASVPIVPLPPAVYGSAASVGLILALRYSRHRRWLTLRG